MCKSKDKYGNKSVNVIMSGVVSRRHVIDFRFLNAIFIWNNFILFLEHRKQRLEAGGDLVTETESTTGICSTTVTLQTKVSVS